jgi:Domain of unknown function DUF29
MANPSTLYDTDFFAWSEQQAEALRAAARGGSNRQLDWENLAEEIEGLGISQRRELKSQIRRVIEHLLKLENSPAIDPRRGWIESINDARMEIEAVLEDSPSLKNEITAAITAEMGRGARKAIGDLEKYGDVEPATLARIRGTAYSEAQILGEWFPEGR